MAAKTRRKKAKRRVKKKAKRTGRPTGAKTERKPLLKWLALRARIVRQAVAGDPDLRRKENAESLALLCQHERQVAELSACGLLPAEIGRTLPTISGHKRRLMDALGLPGEAERADEEGDIDEL